MKPPAPIFGIASWGLPITGSLITYLAVENARVWGGFLAGLHEFVTGTFIVASSALICGFIALARRERFRWLGVVPLLLRLFVLILLFK